MLTHIESSQNICFLAYSFWSILPIIYLHGRANLIYTHRVVSIVTDPVQSLPWFWAIHACRRFSVSIDTTGAKMNMLLLPTLNKQKTKTYNSEDSLVVTHPTTNSPACGLSTAERTGSPVFHTLWSYVSG